MLSIRPDRRRRRGKPAHWVTTLAAVVVTVLVLTTFADALAGVGALWAILLVTAVYVGSYVAVAYVFYRFTSFEF